MKKIAVLLALVGMIVSFQNCGRVSHTDSASISPGNQSPTTYNKYSTSDYNVFSIWDWQNQQFLDVDLKTGEVKAFPEGGAAAGPVYQLKGEELAKAQAILASAQICEPNNDIDPNRVCSMIYKYPYGILVKNNEEVRLGEMTSGCDVPVDLCGTKSDDMKSWSANIIQHLSDGTVTK